MKRVVTTCTILWAGGLLAVWILVPGAPRMASRIVEPLLELVGIPSAWMFHADMSGRADVIDGDTIDVGGQHIRLYGVDAPERGQSCFAEGVSWPCGREAARALADRVDGRQVVCTQRDRDRHGRSVATCRVAGEDVNA